MATPFISKSKYLAGLQCEKLLWYNYNQKEKIPAPDKSLQATFDQGHEVGQLAKELYPGGIEVSGGVRDFEKVLRASLEAVKTRKPLFEPAFRYKNAYARPDILDPVGVDKWDIVEVKSSTEVKDVNLQDLAIQKYTYEGAGLKIRKCFLMYVNNEYVRHGKIDPRKFFVKEDVTDRVMELMPDVESKLEDMIAVIRQKKPPNVPIGPHCSDPYNCLLQEMCWSFLPDDNVFTLYRLGQKAFGLMAKGVLEIEDIPSDYPLSDTQQIQSRALRSGKKYVDKNGIAEFLETLKYPLYYLDFETFRTAIPLFDGVRPYQQIPFQFSLHIVRSKGGDPEHHSYLADGKTDPRPEILEKLKALLGKEGSIVAYNSPFETRVLRESCDACSGYSRWFNSIEGRIVDLLAPFRSFLYYHPDQKGSASIKSVLPALAGVSYDNMEISDGDTASIEFLRVTYGEATESERKKVRKALEEYCGLDTMGMVKIVDALGRLARA